MSYQVALGFNNVGGLADLTIQPKCLGLQEARRLTNGNKKVIGDGGYITQLAYAGLRLDDWLVVLTQFGLESGLLSNEITISLPDNLTRAFANYNAVIELPSFPNEANYSFRLVQSIEFNLRGIQLIV